MKKKILSLALSTALLVTCVPEIGLISKTEAATITQESKDYADGTEYTCTNWQEIKGDSFSLKNGDSYTFYFNNQGHQNGATNNWDNCVLVLKSESANITGAIRMDDYVLNGGTGTGISGFGGTNWDTFAEIQENCDIELSVIRYDNMILTEMKVTGATETTNEKSYISYGITELKGLNTDDLVCGLAGENTILTIKKVEYSRKDIPLPDGTKINGNKDYGTGEEIICSGFMTATSKDTFTLSNGAEYEFYFNNKGNQSKTEEQAWFNNIMKIQNGSNDFAIRLDQYAFSGNGGLKCSAFGGIDFKTESAGFIALTKDCDIKVKVKRINNVLMYTSSIGDTYNVSGYVVMSDSMLTADPEISLSGESTNMLLYNVTSNRDTLNVDNTVKTYAQYKKISDNNYTLRIISEVSIPEDTYTSYQKIGFRCSKAVSSLTDESQKFLGTEVFKSIKANGKTISADKDKYFVVLEINNVTADGALKLQTEYITADNSTNTIGNAIEVKMANIIN